MATSVHTEVRGHVSEASAGGQGGQAGAVEVRPQRLTPLAQWMILKRPPQEFKGSKYWQASSGGVLQVVRPPVNTRGT